MIHNKFNWTLTESNFMPDEIVRQMGSFEKWFGSRIQSYVQDYLADGTGMEHQFTTVMNFGWSEHEVAEMLDVEMSELPYLFKLDPGTYPFEVEGGLTFSFMFILRYFQKHIDGARQKYLEQAEELKKQWPQGVEVFKPQWMP